MNLKQFVKEMESRVASALKVEASVIADELRRDIPANRTLTRQAVKVRRLGETRYDVGLFFQRRYPGNNTETHRILRRSWAALRPIARERLINRINDALHR